MKLRDWFRFGARGAGSARNQAGDGGTPIDLKSPYLAEALRGGMATASGAFVNPDSALNVATVWRCVTIITGVVSSMPLHLMATDPQDDRRSKKAKDHPLYKVLHYRPNGWQHSAGFRAMMQAHVLLRGNAYAYKVVGFDGNVRELIPLHPDRVKPAQRDDLSLVYTYTRPDGRIVLFEQKDIFHLRDLSSDGIVGISRIAKMREAVGLAMQTERFGAKVFKNDAALGIALSTPNSLSDTAYERLKVSMQEEYGGVENAHKTIILEESLKADRIGMTSEDAQFLQTRQFQSGEIALFFGVPPHLAGDTKSTTNWGTGIEQSNIGFLQFTVWPWTTEWEGALQRDVIPSKELGEIYAKFNFAGLLRASANDRANYYAKALGSGGTKGWMTQNEVRGLDELNPSDDPEADKLPQATSAPTPAASGPNDPQSGGANS